MQTFLKAIAGIIVGLLLWICLSKHNKEYATILTIVVCVAVLSVVITFLQPLIGFVEQLQNITNVDTDLITIVLKVVGVGILSEYVALVCKDSGNESMGKALQILSSIVVLWLSIPVFEKLLTLIDEILGSI